MSASDLAMLKSQMEKLDIRPGAISPAAVHSPPQQSVLLASAPAAMPVHSAVAPVRQQPQPPPAAAPKKATASKAKAKVAPPMPAKVLSHIRARTQAMAKHFQAALCFIVFWKKEVCLVRTGILDT
jgi:biotin carboxyl carrier protein